VNTRKKDRATLEEELRKYILGELTERDEELFEQRLMTEDEESLKDVDALAEALHDELVDDYLSGRLTGSQRTSFEGRLRPCRKVREKLILGKALRGAARRESSSLAERLEVWIRSILRPLPAVVACTSLLILIGGGWSVSRIALLQSQLDQAASRQASLTAAQQSLRSQLDDERQRSDALARALAAAASRLGSMEQSVARGAVRAVSAAASFILKPGLLRSGAEVTRVTAGPGEGLVELKLDLGLDEHPGYRATLHDSADTQLMLIDKLRAVTEGGNVYVVVRLPAKILRAGDYQLRLSGVSANGQTVKIDSYPFQVINR
jgi:hypothetical protein